MSITWMRHGEKEYRNSRGPPCLPKHDSTLKMNSKIFIETICSDIFRNFGIPNYILVSPFLRTRETGIIIKQYIKENLNLDIDIYVNNDISEYLGYQEPKGETADVFPQTSEFIKPLLGNETFKDLEMRVQKHLAELPKSDNILVVTHGIVICYINKALTGMKMNKIKELSGINLKNGKVEKFDFLIKN